MNYDARIKPEMIDELVAGREPSEIFGQNGLLDRLRQALVERFATETQSAIADRQDLDREALLRLKADADDLDGAFDDEGGVSGLSLAAYRKRFAGFDEQFISLYERGLSSLEIRRRLTALYGVTVGAETVSALTLQLVREALAWQSRALEILYPIVVFEAVRVKSRGENGAISHKACHFALGFHANGAKEVLGLWMERSGGEQFWRGVLGDLKRRGAGDVLIFVNAAAGFREAADAVYPQAQSQSCIVELIRASLDLTSSKNRSPMSSALKEIYEAPSQECARASLQKFAAGEWGSLYPAVATLWERRWSEITPFFALPLEIRRIISTLFAREVLLRSMTRMLRACEGALTDDETSARLFLVIKNGQKLWKRPQREWHGARSQFAAIFPDRFTTR